MELAVDLAIAKTSKYGTRESGDTAEVVERPTGGLSVVTVDGQGSGRAAKTLSLLLTSRAVALLKDGARDGAVARAVSDFLLAYRHGQVSATLDILSVDLATRTVVLTRNAVTPALVWHGGAIEVLPPGPRPIGLYVRTRPTVREFSLEEGLRVLTMTDGVAHAGERAGLGPFDVAAFVAGLPADTDAVGLADAVVGEALRRDGDRPHDDQTAVALVVRGQAEPTAIRRLSVTLPLG